MKTFKQFISEALDVKNNPNFWKWFSGSKVVDARGNPLVVYHGTMNSFNSFDNYPIYFTCDPHIASAYAHGGYGEDNSPNVVAAYLSIQNMVVVTKEELDEIVGPENDRNWEGLDNHAEDMMNKGYDGLKVMGAVDFSGVVDGVTQRTAYDQYIVFKSTQVKSAIGNNGEFDPNNRDITK